ncbi:hypothetical protein [Acinetobacter beijerinckii]|uniref:hypothetical protein n=1 Tax=Acinetobacter beijerinckii TaxID=262668 RepID=UPI0030D8F05B
MENNIVEGQLTFLFPEQNATKYDEWSFYRNQFNAVCGSKAVDLLYVEQQILWLIEIKDYRQHARTKPIDLADEIALKVRDTLAGLVAAQVNANDQTEQDFAKNALKKKKIRVVLHLEQAVQSSRLFLHAINPANVQLKLKQKVRAIDAHPLVVDQRSKLLWSVI